MASLISGKFRYALAELASLPRAAVVVEDRYSAIFKLDRIRPALVADGLAEVQVRWPNVPIVLRDPAAGRGVDLPVPGRRPHLGRTRSRRTGPRHPSHRRD
ncbi:MAG: ERCC4 domain-containing protein [Streptosporangiaceae bacterium]|nr:ERCC4 domain-containing protein [Streptosporangiaceae bacterium]